MLKSSSDVAPRHAALSDLTEQQLEAAEATGPVLVLAGAGTGKTNTLTAAVVQRIAADRVSPSRILAVTFTNKAATEMATRIRASLGGIAAPSWLGTFHGLAARQLRTEPEIAGLRPGFDILDADDSRRIVKRTMKAHQPRRRRRRTPQTGRDPLKIMGNRISKFKDNLVTPQDAPAYDRSHDRGRANASANRSIDPTVFAPARGSMPIISIVCVTETRPILAICCSGQRSRLLRNEDYRDRWAERFDCLLADEYQDVNLPNIAGSRLLSARTINVSSRSATMTRRSIAGAGATSHISAASPATFRTPSDPPRREFPLAPDTSSPPPTPSSPTTTTGLARPSSPESPSATASRSSVSATRKPKRSGSLPRNPAPPCRGRRLGRLRDPLSQQLLCRAVRGSANARPHPLCHRRRRRLLPARRNQGRARLVAPCATPDDRQSDEAFRRVINVPRRGFGAKALQILENEAAWRKCLTSQRSRNRRLPAQEPRRPGLEFADAIRRLGPTLRSTLADQLSLLLDATGYRAMLRESKAETTEDRLENFAANSSSSPAPFTPPATCSTTRPWPPAVPTRTRPPGPADDAP